MIYMKNSNQVKTEERNCFRNDRYSRMYLEDNYVKKIYLRHCLEKYRLNVEVADVIDNVNSANLAKIHEIYYDNIMRKVEGYVRDYYQSSNMNILEENVEYTLENIHNITVLFDKLATHCIKVGDIKLTDMVLQDEKIILTNPDTFVITEDSKDECFRYNNIILLNLFKNIYKKAISENLIDFKEINPYFILDDLFKVNGDNLEEEISKKLIKYKYPIEYFRTK